MHASLKIKETRLKINDLRNKIYGKG